MVKLRTFAAQGETGIATDAQGAANTVLAFGGEDSGFPYHLPLQVDADGLTIVDSMRTVVVPSIAYAGDMGHVRRQKDACFQICKAINAVNGWKPVTVELVGGRRTVKWGRADASGE